MRNGIFHVAKEEGSDQVLGVACWLKPQTAGKPQSWADWLEDWRLWLNQVSMNLFYGRGGLIVNVSPGCFVSVVWQITVRGMLSTPEVRTTLASAMPSV